MDHRRQAALRYNPNSQCDILLQSCYTHVSALNGVIQNFLIIGSLDLQVLQAEINHLRHFAKSVFQTLQDDAKMMNVMKMITRTIKLQMIYLMK